MFIKIANTSDPYQIAMQNIYVFQFKNAGIWVLYFYQCLGFIDQYLSKWWNVIFIGSQNIDSNANANVEWIEVRQMNHIMS